MGWGRGIGSYRPNGMMNNYVQTLNYMPRVSGQSASALTAVPAYAVRRPTFKTMHKSVWQRMVQRRRWLEAYNLYRPIYHR